MAAVIDREKQLRSGAKGVMVTAVELQHWLGINGQNIPALLNDGVLLKNNNNLYDLFENVTRYIERLKARQKNAGGPLPPSFTEARARMTEAKAKLAELEAAKREGKLLESEQVEDVWSKAVIHARTRLLGIPSKLAPRIVTLETAGEAEAAIEAEIQEALEELGAARIVAVTPVESFNGDEDDDLDEVEDPESELQSPRRRGVQAHNKSVEAPAKNNRLPVGRPRTKTL